MKLQKGEMSEENEEGITEEERKTFAEVMEMVRECLG
jgi:hypothetical protein